MGAAAQEPTATGPGWEKESERGRGRRRLHPTQDVEPAAGGARAGAPPASCEGKAASGSGFLRCRFPPSGTRGLRAGTPERAALSCCVWLEPAEAAILRPGIPALGPSPPPALSDICPGHCPAAPPLSLCLAVFSPITIPVPHFSRQLSPTRLHTSFPCGLRPRDSLLDAGASGFLRLAVLLPSSGVPRRLDFFFFLFSSSQFCFDLMGKEGQLLFSSSSPLSNTKFSPQGFSFM